MPKLITEIRRFVINELKIDDKGTINLLLSDAEIPKAKIADSPQVTSYWQNVLSYSDEVGKLEKLLNVLMDERGLRKPDEEFTTKEKGHKKKIEGFIGRIKAEEHVHKVNDQDIEDDLELSHEDRIKSIRNFISGTDNLLEGIGKMQKLVNEVPQLTSLEGDVINLAGRINFLHRQQTSGVIGREDFMIERNRLRNAIISTLDRMNTYLQF